MKTALSAVTLVVARNQCLEFNSLLLNSSQRDLVALGKVNGYEFPVEELECKDTTKSHASYANTVVRRMKN